MNINYQLASQVITHYLKIFGFSNDFLDGHVNIIYKPKVLQFENIIRNRSQYTINILIQPSSCFCKKINLIPEILDNSSYFFLTSDTKKESKLTYLEKISLYKDNSDWNKLAVSDSGSSIWLTKKIKNNNNLIILGNNIVSDLIRYTHGDPEQVKVGQKEPMWGFNGERPNYLFEKQRNSDSKYERQADKLMKALSEAITSISNKQASDILPHGAKGAIVFTGDDDQAYLEKYKEQVELLKNLPITYLLHPDTKHTKETLRKILGNPRIELGIHPDALDNPKEYEHIFSEQVKWFKKLVGHAPLSVRNHGFLNDGYWGHLNSWLKEDVLISSNLPGFDGNVLNASLLPSRIVHSGELTQHWSILTAIGDGVMFAGNKNSNEAAQCVYDLADNIIKSQIPGVIVLNLHPQNVEEAKLLHLAAIDLINEGFIPWNLSECIAWFSRNDDNPIDIRHLQRSYSKRERVKLVFQDLFKKII